MAKSDREFRPSKNPIHIQRLANVKALIKSRFDEKASAFAAEIGRSHTVVWQWLNQYRAIGEDSARLVERKLGMGIGDLDKSPKVAFERNVVMTTPLGGGETARVLLVPVIDAKVTVQIGKLRREQMAKSKFYVPCAGPCSEDAYAVVVDFASMEPRVRRGDRAVIEPTDREPKDERFYWILVKGAETPVMRMAVEQDRGRYVFTLPPENKRVAQEKALPSAEVKVLGRATLTVREI